MDNNSPSSNIKKVITSPGLYLIVTFFLSLISFCIFSSGSYHSRDMMYISMSGSSFENVYNDRFEGMFDRVTFVRLKKLCKETFPSDFPSDERKL